MRFTLRPLQATDDAGILAVACSEETFRFIPGAPARYTQADARAHLDELLMEAAAGHLSRAIVGPEGVYVGNLVIRPSRASRGLPTVAGTGHAPELGFSLHAQWRGKGVVGALLPRFLAEAPSMLEARCHADNIPSRRLLERHGFEGVAQDGPWMHWRRAR